MLRADVSLASRAQIPCPRAALCSVCHCIPPSNKSITVQAALLLHTEQAVDRPPDLVEKQGEYGHRGEYGEHEPPRQRGHQRSRQGERYDAADIDRGSREDPLA